MTCAADEPSPSRAWPSLRRAVDLRAEFESSGVEEVLDELDRELIGLAPVKKRIRETAALLLVEQARASAWASPTRRRRCT